MIAADERERLRRLLIGQTASFDQNLNIVDEDADAKRELYRLVLDIIQQQGKRHEEPIVKCIADLAWLGWQAMQIEYLKRTLEEETSGK